MGYRSWWRKIRRKIMYKTNIRNSNFYNVFEMVKFMERLAKDVGISDSLGIILKFIQQIMHQFLRLSFGPHNGADLGFDIGTDHMHGLG